MDLPLCQISITRSAQQLHKVDPEKPVTLKDTKTQKSRRMVSLTPSNCVILHEHLDARKQFLKTLNPDFDPDKDFDNNERVVCRIDGSPLRPDSVTHAWIKLRKKCGLLGVRLHDARHTHATIMLKQGIHPKIVSERLGHAGIAITLDLYSHVAPGLQQAAANKFDDIVMGKSDKANSEVPR